LTEEGPEHGTARRRRRDGKESEKNDNEKNRLLKIITRLQIKI